MLAALPRTAWLVLPLAGIISSGLNFWTTSGLSLTHDSIPIAVAVAVPLLALPGFLLGLGLLAADCVLPVYRHVWISIELLLVVVIVLLGLLLGLQCDF